MCRSPSCSAPRPSMTKRTIWVAPATGAGNHGGRSSTSGVVNCPSEQGDDPVQAGPVPVRQQGARHRCRLIPPRSWGPSRPSTPACPRSRGHTLRPTHHLHPPRHAWRPVASRGVRVSTRGDYASRALLSLALHGAETPTSVRDIAERTGLPQPYLEQILLALKGAGTRALQAGRGRWVRARPPTRGHLAGPDRLRRRRPDSGRRLRRAARQRRVQSRGAMRPAGRMGGRGRDHPSAPSVPQPGRHGGPGPGATWPPRSEVRAPDPALERGHRFHRSIAGQPSSHPRIPIDPASRRRSRAATGGSPSQRAATTRSRCPCATHSVVPSWPRPARSPGRPAVRRRRPARRSARRPPRGSNRAGPRGSPPR